MPDNLDNLKMFIEKEFPNFTGRIVLDMYEGQLGATERTSKKRYALKNKPSVAHGADTFSH